jgi:hypothetical protein
MKEEKEVKEVEVKEFEWYLRDHIFRQSNNQGRQKFQKETLAKEMMNLYLRYRNSDLENLNEMVNRVSENLLLRKVIKMTNSDTDKSLELTRKLSRLQCSKCFYISYLSSNEPKDCLRCSSTELHEFPKRK